MSKKLLLIDGHSILNRAFYGLPDMTNAKGEHTNAVLGFLNILFKLIDEEKPSNLCVAFDVNKPTFRHIRYEEYKGTRKPMPEELREQVPLIKEVLKSMNVSMIEKGGYEADDILGTLSRKASKDGFNVTIVSGDRDLLQLATDDILIRIPKTKMSKTIIEDYHFADVLEKYEVTPTEFIDLKGLMGDTADNIPGVPGIGEKTATKIIKEYKSIENAHDHIDEIKPNKAKENLENFYDQAILSKELATIKLDCDIEFDSEETTYNNPYTNDAYLVLKRLEFKSLLNRFSTDNIVEAKKDPIVCIVVDDLVSADKVFSEAVNAPKKGVYFLRNEKCINAIAISYEANKVYLCIPKNFITTDYLYDKGLSILKSQGHIGLFELKSILGIFPITENDSNIFDLDVAAYLINPLNSTYNYDDIARIYLDDILPSKENLLNKTSELDCYNDNFARFVEFSKYIASVAYSSMDILIDKLSEYSMLDLYINIEYPTIFALYDMEKWGVKVRKDALEEYGKSLVGKISQLEQSIYDQAGQVFNINSPKQLGVVLFEDLSIPNGKKTKTGYSTSVDVLEKLSNEYPIINDILEYRQLTKLKSTYADGLANYICEDGRIHGKFNQTVTATGRISSTEPNLQNIPIKMPLGREIRKVFVPEKDYVFLDADYSQIELRVLAHISNDQTLIDAYNNNLDIHAITASQVFNTPLEEVTKLQRSNAKAVNFGIVYGISAFGLSQDLNISRKQAQEYIDNYLSTYHQVKNFLNETVEQAKQDGFVKTIFNRLRPIPELSSNNFMQRNFGERVAMNSPIQGTAADIIKIAMIKVNIKLKELKLKSRLVLQIHDELLIETHKDEIDTVKTILTDEMINAAQLLVPLEIEINQGDNWFEAK